MNTIPKLNYDAIAPEYNQRYPTDELSARGKALLALAQRTSQPFILEVGSGTGHWLAALRPFTGHLYGVDLSAGMLSQARARDASLNLTRGAANQLPLESERFDLVYCVDAIHHFGDARAFIAEAFRLLKPGGVLAVFGNDPHGERDAWYVYDYFEGVLATDLRRFPSTQQVQTYMREAGFDDVTTRDVEHILSIHRGRAVFDDPYLKKTSSSQLALLSEAAYAAGMEHIRQSIARAEARGETAVFRSELHVLMTMGVK